MPRRQWAGTHGVPGILKTTELLSQRPLYPVVSAPLLSKKRSKPKFRNLESSSCSSSVHWDSVTQRDRCPATKWGWLVAGGWWLERRATGSVGPPLRPSPDLSKNP